MSLRNPALGLILLTILFALFSGCTNPGQSNANLEIINQSNAKIGTIGVVIDGSSIGNSQYGQNADNSLLAKGQAMSFDVEIEGVVTVELYHGIGQTMGSAFASQVITWSIPDPGSGKLILRIVDTGNSVAIIP